MSEIEFEGEESNASEASNEAEESSSEASDEAEDPLVCPTASEVDASALAFNNSVVVECGGGGECGNYTTACGLNLINHLGGPFTAQQVRARVAQDLDEAVYVGDGWWTDRHIQQAARTFGIAINVYDHSRPEGHRIQRFHPEADVDILRELFILNHTNRHYQLCLPPDQVNIPAIQRAGGIIVGSFAERLAAESESARATGEHNAPAQVEASDVSASILSVFKDAAMMRAFDPEPLRLLNQFLQEELCSDPSRPSTSNQTDEQRRRTSKLQVLLQEVVRNNPILPPDVIAKFEFVNALIGTTSAGKDKTGSTILNRDVANSAADVATKAQERISQIQDQSAKSLVIEITDLKGKRDSHFTLADANSHRKTLHNAEEDFPSGQISMLIRDPDPQTVNVTFLNFPGFIAFVKDGDQGARLFKVINEAVNKIAENQSGVLYIVARAGSAVANEPWQYLDVFQDPAKPRLPIVFILTHGDQLNVPPDLKTYWEYEDLYFGQIRKVVPNAECVIICNWAGDSKTIPMADGLLASQKKLRERMEDIIETVEGNAIPTYRGSAREREEKDRLFSCMGNDQLLQRFWATAAQHAGKPLKLLLRCFQEGVDALQQDSLAAVEILESYGTLSIGEELEHFTGCFVDNRIPFFLGNAVAGRENGNTYESAAKDSMLTAEEEYKRIVSDFELTLPDLPPPEYRAATASPDAWMEILKSLNRDLNASKHFVFHILLRRFWANMEELINKFELPDMDFDYLNASIARSEVANVFSRHRAIFTHVKNHLNKAFVSLGDFIPQYISALCVRVAQANATYVLSDPQFSTLRQMPDVLNSISKTIRRFYREDLCSLLKRKITHFGERFTDVDPDGEERFADLLGKAGGILANALAALKQLQAQPSAGGKPVSLAEDKEMAKEKLPRKIFAEIMKQLRQIFKSQLLLHLQQLRATDIKYALSQYRLYKEQESSVEASVFFKHLAMDLLGPEKILEAMCANQPAAAALVRRNQMQISSISASDSQSQVISVPDEEEEALTKLYLGPTLFGRMIFPPMATEIGTLTRFNLLGLVQHWDKKDGFVLSSAYFAPLTYKGRHICVDQLNKHFAKDASLRFSAVQRAHDNIQSVKPMIQLLAQASEFFALIGSPDENVIDTDRLLRAFDELDEVSTRLKAAEADLKKEGLTPTSTAYSNNNKTATQTLDTLHKIGRAHV